jgi:LemA protein
MKSVLVVLLVLVGIGFIFALWIYGTYNGLVTLDEETKKAYAQVDVVLQRRFDLIPNLVETVKGYAAHEKEVLMGVTEARSRVGSAQSISERVGAQNELSSALARLLVVVENYPQLKADQNFLALQDELAGTENRISVERRRYNETATEYNKRIRKVPANIIAGMFGFERAELLEAPTGAETPPKVEF